MVTQDKKMDAKQAISLDSDSIAAFSKASNEPDWLTNIRLNAWDSFRDLEWPAADEEDASAKYGQHTKGGWFWDGDVIEVVFA